MKRAFWLMFFLALAAGTASGTQTGTANPATISIGGLIELKLPADAHLTPLGGVDSLIGEITAAGMTCRYDLGSAANSLTRVKGASVTESRREDKPTRRITSPEGLEGMHIAQLKRDVTGWIGFTIVCNVENDIGRTAANQMFSRLRLLDP